MKWRCFFILFSPWSSSMLFRMKFLAKKLKDGVEVKQAELGGLWSGMWEGEMWQAAKHKMCVYTISLKKTWVVRNEGCLGRRGTTVFNRFTQATSHRLQLWMWCTLSISLNQPEEGSQSDTCIPFTAVVELFQQFLFYSICSHPCPYHLLLLAPIMPCVLLQEKGKCDCEDNITCLVKGNSLITANSMLKWR